MLVHFLRKLSSNLTEKGKDLPGLEIRDAFSDKSKWMGAFGEYLGTFDKRLESLSILARYAACESSRGGRRHAGMW